MSFADYEEQRRALLEAFRSVEGFVRDDSAFRGERTEEATQLRQQRALVEEGQYRVVFLGSFNVGKSTAINALLGGPYLPMDVEECTSELAFIRGGEDMTLELSLKERLDSLELDVLDRFCRPLAIRIRPLHEEQALLALFDQPSPGAMRQCLEALLTVQAEDDYPQLASLRTKLGEVRLQLPAAVIPESIVLVDTPGVESVSDTRQDITYGVLERSHLVVVFIDSGFIGNVHDLRFIKRIVERRGRRVLFVLNKADRLEAAELEAAGESGPAQELKEVLARHGIADAPGIYFLSGYRGLRAQDLDSGRYTWADAMRDNRLGLTAPEREALEQAPAREDALRDHLLTLSRLPRLKDALQQYLLEENTAGVVLESAARMLAQRCDDYLARIETELRLAEDPARFEELKENRAALDEKLAKIRTRAERILADYHARSMGGTVGETTHPGYEERLRAMLPKEAVEEAVVQPVLAWLAEGEHLRECRRDDFRPLARRLEDQIDGFVAAKLQDLRQEVRKVEDETRDAIGAEMKAVRGLRLQMTETTPKRALPRVEAAAADYLGIGAGGFAAGAAAGALLGSLFVPGVGTALGAGLGSLLGIAGGLGARMARRRKRLLDRLEPVVREQVFAMLLNGAADAEGKRVPPVVETVGQELRERADAFYDAVRREVDQAVRAVQREMDDLLAREHEIRSEREQILKDLRPRADALRTQRDAIRALAARLADPA